jgi:hypothetical protein
MLLIEVLQQGTFGQDKQSLQLVNSCFFLGGNFGAISQSVDITEMRFRFVS